MNMIIQITTAIALILSIIVPFGCFFLGEKNKKRYKKSLIANCFMFFGVLLRSYGRRYRTLRTDHFLYDPW